LVVGFTGKHTGTVLRFILSVAIGIASSIGATQVAASIGGWRAVPLMLMAGLFMFVAVSNATR